MKAAGMIILFSLFVACRQQHPAAKNNPAFVATIPAVQVRAGDTALQWRNGLYYYRQLPFSGHVVERYANDMVQYDRSYRNGKEEGWHFSYYPGGALSEQRYYHAGEKDSVHTGWWPNGRLRFEYHFNNGLYHGDFKEWYATGQAYKQIHYTYGADDNGRGWRENGKIYMSYITRNGRRYGLVNANLCYTLKNENGEFIKSIPDSIAAGNKSSM